MDRVCVFCGSSSGKDPAYTGAARALGTALARRGLGLVYGGASVGLMGAVADAVLVAGGEVIGVLPRALSDREIAHPGLTELRIVDTMHERKATMAELSDGFVALPGGLGTLEELFEILTWAQLGVHHKPVGLLGVGDFFKPLIEFLDSLVAQGFVRPQHRSLLLTEATPEALLERMESYRSPVEARWWLKLGET